MPLCSLNLSHILVFPLLKGFFFFLYKICNSSMQCLKYKNCKKQQGAALKLKCQKLLPHMVDVSHGFQESAKETQVDFLPDRPEGRTLVCSQNQRASTKIGT